MVRPKSRISNALIQSFALLEEVSAANFVLFSFIFSYLFVNIMFPNQYSTKGPHFKEIGETFSLFYFIDLDHFIKLF